MNELITLCLKKAGSKKAFLKRRGGQGSWFGVAGLLVLDRTIDVHIRNLRENLGPGAALMVENTRGVGSELEP